MVNDNQTISTGKMKMKIMNALLVISLSSTCSSIAANDFKCRVTDSVKLLESGKMSGSGNMSYSGKTAMHELGKEFTVNRLSGVVTGSGFENNKFGEKPAVYNYTPKYNNTYSVITIYKPSNIIDYLEIQEWVDTPQKPFLFRGGWTLQLVSGLCEYY